MNVGPDGSLCRITSSYKDLVNNIRIIKEPDSQPFYKLVVLKSPDEQEEEPEKSSDDEISEDEWSDIEFPSKSVEKETVADKPINKIDKQNETISEEVMKERNHYNRHRPYHNRNKRFYNRRNNFNKVSERCKGLSNMEGVYNYGNRDFNSKANRNYNSNRGRDFKNNRHFISKPNHHIPYNTPSPWIESPTMVSNLNYLSDSFSVVPEKPRNFFGLLGDRPSYVLPEFQSNQQNDKYIHDQNSTYTPMSSNFQSNSQSDNFVCDQASLHSPMTSNYSSGKQANFSCDQNYWNNGYGNYNKSNQRGNKYSNNTNKQKQNSWNKKAGRYKNVRNKPSFEHRN